MHLLLLTLLRYSIPHMLLPLFVRALAMLKLSLPLSYMLKGHYAMAAGKLMPWARQFNVVKISQLSKLPNAVPLTDPNTAEMWCAVVQR